jgi:hypothetical protein
LIDLCIALCKRCWGLMLSLTGHWQLLRLTPRVLFISVFGCAYSTGFFLVKERASKSSERASRHQLLMSRTGASALETHPSNSGGGGSPPHPPDPLTARSRGGVTPSPPSPPGGGGATLKYLWLSSFHSTVLHSPNHPPVLSWPSTVQDAFQLEGEPYCRHQLLKFGSGAPVIIAVGTGLALPGYTLIVDEAGAADLYATLVNKVSAVTLPRKGESLRGGH